MHDELCRFCGADLTNFSICPECRKPVRRICTRCTRKTEEHLHMSCLSGVGFMKERQYDQHVAPVDVRTRIAEIA